MPSERPDGDVECVTLREYVDYYNTARPHQSPDRNAPTPREVDAVREVCAKPVLSGLHHRYFRAA